MRRSIDNLVDTLSSAVDNTARVVRTRVMKLFTPFSTLPVTPPTETSAAPESSAAPMETSSTAPGAAAAPLKVDAAEDKPAPMEM